MIAHKLKPWISPPVGTLDMAEVPDMWHAETIRYVCVAPNLLDDGPWILGALRGAIGHVLHDMKAIDRIAMGSLFPQSHAFPVFYEDPGSYPSFTKIPKPFLLKYEREGGHIIFDVTLVGEATYWWPEFDMAMRESFNRGLPLKENGKMRVPFEFIEFEHDLIDGVAVPTAAINHARIRFLTPLCLRNDKVLKSDLSGILYNICDRVRTMTLWQMFEMTFDAEEFAQNEAEIRITESKLHPKAWPRFSSREPGVARVMAGVVGHIDLEGDLDYFRPLLTLLPHCHLGGWSAFGLGHCEVDLY